MIRHAVQNEHDSLGGCGVIGCLPEMSLGPPPVLCRPAVNSLTRLFGSIMLSNMLVAMTPASTNLSVPTLE